MRASVALLASATAVLGQMAPMPAADGRYTISSAGIKAQFIKYGASLTNLWVKDKHGMDIDVVLGYDNSSYYPVDPGHPVYNSIPGRYVSRIGNATYAIDGKTYHTEANDGTNTLHSGTNNWSYRFWNVSAVSDDSITFSIVDPDGAEKGLPGDVDASVTYLVANGTLHITMWAKSPQAKTPLMLTHHTYFNLNAFKNPASVKIWDHVLSMPYSQRYLAQDDGAVPTGPILTASPNSINDFASAKDLTLGHAVDVTGFSSNCGGGGNCEGYNGYWLIEGAPKDAVVVTLSSAFSGVKAELRTDQPGVVIYSCNWMDGSAPLKSDQGLPDKNVTKVTRSSCVAIEAQDYPNGLNHPEWNRTDAEITGPGKTYTWASSWTFSNL